MNTVAHRRLLTGILLAAGLLAGGVIAWRLHGQGYNLREMVVRIGEWMRIQGPVPFFLLMLFLPAAGVPITVFTLSAGSVFSPTLGLPLVLLLSFICIGLNLVFTYALARWVFRPWVERLCGWLGFRLPDVPLADQRSLVVMLRLTPGPPYVFQNYLAGVARIHFSVYLTTSWVLAVLDASIYIIFGSALVHGSGRMVLTAVGLFVVLSLAGRLIYKRVKGKAGNGLADAERVR
jgi:uncharacterized membrane protein YdjX (TVP38/TMEM64 family)